MVHHFKYSHDGDDGADGGDGDDDDLQGQARERWFASLTVLITQSVCPNHSPALT